LIDALEHVDQIVVGIDAVHPAGDRQALEDAHVLGAHLCPSEQEIFSAHGDDPQGSLQVVGVDQHLGDLRPRAPLQEIAEGLGRPARLGEAGVGAVAVADQHRPVSRRQWQWGQA